VINDKTVEYFQMLSLRGYEPMLSNVTATIRFDIANDQQSSSWRLEVDRGKLTVSPEAEARHPGDSADCVITADKARFDGIAGDGVNAMAALLRGEIAVSGDPELLVAVQRLFPKRARVEPAGSRADLWPMSPAFREVDDRDL
jgi:putative sterol carrier protein